MRADDQHNPRDPLDRWLNQQVQPLPPPPGTFELITRRARGRKLRKLAVTVVSAAAVAAAVAFAVPAGLKLNLSQPPTSGHYAAGSSPTGPAQHTADGSATPITTPSPSRPATHPLIQPAGPVPANFQPSSVTFVSTETGWVIGQAGTPGQCDNVNPDICTSIARTDNAGQSWQGGPAPDTTGPNGPTGVSGIRFLNQTDGWAFGPELWATDDGGTQWTKVDTHGAEVTDLEASGGRAYALFADCSTPTGAGASSPSFAAGCIRYTLMTAAAGSDDWVAVGAATTGLGNERGAVDSASAVLELTGSDGYLLAPDGTLYTGPIGGTWTSAGSAPCGPGAPPGANGLPQAAQLALVNSTQLAMICNATSAAGPPTLYTSSDSGATWTQQPAAASSGLAAVGPITSLAAAPNGTLVLATSTGIYSRSADGSQWQASSAAGSKAPSGGFSYVGMTTDDQGIALPADTSLHEIWMTFDGGQTWSPATSITPGN
jgi:hypothetical protein